MERSDFQHIRITRSTSTPIRFDRPVEVVIRTSAQCRDDPDLAAFSVTEGPAAEECKGIIARLLNNEAREQTVGMLKLQGSSAVLGLVSVRTQNVEVMANPFNPDWLRRLGSHRYVGLLARDDRYRNYELADGTRLGPALVRVGVEMATPLGQPAPKTWAFVKRDNRSSIRAFARLAFHPDPRSPEDGQLVLVRSAGKPLPPAPDVAALRPACVTEGPLAA